MTHITSLRDLVMFALCMFAECFRPEVVTILKYARVLLWVEVRVSKVFKSVTLLLGCGAKENKPFTPKGARVWQNPRMPAVTCLYQPKQVSKQKDKSTRFQFVVHFYHRDKGKSQFRHRF